MKEDVERKREWTRKKDTERMNKKERYRENEQERKIQREWTWKKKKERMNRKKDRERIGDRWRMREGRLPGYPLAISS
jgi:hypothetical protein